MDLQNCRRCGALCLRDRSQYCAECAKWFADTYGQIRDYLRTYPNRTLWDVHKELDIPLSVVQQVIRFSEEERGGGDIGGREDQRRKRL